MRTVLAFGALACLLALPRPVLAQAEKNAAEKGAEKKAAPKAEAPKAPALTATSAAQAGDDYFFQGEFSGKLLGGAKLGLQVIAEGDGHFRGVEYAGGLPGDGWDGSERKEYTATAWGEWLRLVGHGRKIDVQVTDAVVRDGAGRQLGALRKVRRQSPSLGASPTAGAVVLFDGESTDKLANAKVTPEGLLMHGFSTKDPVRDFYMHVEFQLPFMPFARGQARGNSGVYIQQRYELQVLDSFGLKGEFNECGSLYRTKPPDVNMCLPPLTWQTYDIFFTAARFDAAGKKTASATLTVFHNGVIVQNRLQVANKTGAGQPEAGNDRPILFQDHGNPVRFRNLWMVPGRADELRREFGL